MRGRDGRRGAAGLVLAGLLLVASACGGGGEDGEDDDPVPRRHVVVALGDSFTAGEGAPPYDADPERCRRAAGAWPRLLGEVAVVASVELRACAGAQTEHLTGPWEGRGLDAQIPDEPDPDVTLVVLTIGGNDIGFGDIVASCVILTCSPAPDSDELEARLDALRIALVQDVHPRLAAAYPEARVVHVGYPHLAPPPDIDPRCLWMSGADQRAARGIVDALDETAADAAEQAGTAEHLDVSDAFAGHELCTRDPWVNDVGFGPGAAHPDADGQRALARAVAEALELPARS